MSHSPFLHNIFIFPLYSTVVYCTQQNVLVHLLYFVCAVTTRANFARDIFLYQASAASANACGPRLARSQSVMPEKLLLSRARTLLPSDVDATLGSNSSASAVPRPLGAALQTQTATGGQPQRQQRQRSRSAENLSAAFLSAPASAPSGRASNSSASSRASTPASGRRASSKRTHARAYSASGAPAAAAAAAGTAPQRTATEAEAGAGAFSKKNPSSSSSSSSSSTTTSGSSESGSVELAASASVCSSSKAVLCGSGSRRARQSAEAERERRLLERYSELLQHVDGVLCFGGDGLLSEVVNGLLIRTRRLHELSDAAHRSDSLELQPALRIGALLEDTTRALSRVKHWTPPVCTIDWFQFISCFVS